MTDLHNYMLGQIAQTTHSTASAVHELQIKVGQIGETQAREVEHLERVRLSLLELTTWAQRLAVLACLWGAALGINVAPEKLGEFVANLLRLQK
jgi:hypothetical protein